MTKTDEMGDRARKVIQNGEREPFLCAFSGFLSFFFNFCPLEGLILSIFRVRKV